MGLLRLAHSEVPQGRFVETRVRDMIAQCLASGFILLSLSHGEPVGTLGLTTESWWWSDEPVLQERWVYVHPEHRRAPHARGLLEMARLTAKDARMDLLIGVLSTIRTSGKVRLFQRVFGAPTGATFLMRA